MVCMGMKQYQTKYSVSELNKEAIEESVYRAKSIEIRVREAS